MSKSHKKDLKEAMSDTYPRIFVEEVQELDDGTANMVIHTNKAFDDLYKERTGKKRVSKTGLSKFVRDILNKNVEANGFKVDRASEVAEDEG